MKEINATYTKKLAWVAGVQVHLSNNHIETDLHTKPTDKHELGHLGKGVSDGEN